MATRRRLLLGGSLLAPVTALAIGISLLWPHTSICSMNGRKVKTGMMQTEVEAILGGPARSEGKFRAFETAFVDKPSIWETDRTLIRVCFDAEGHVTQCLTWESNEGVLDMLRRVIISSSQEPSAFLILPDD